MYHHPTEGVRKQTGGHFRSFQTPQALGHFWALLGLPRPSVVSGPAWGYGGLLRSLFELVFVYIHFILN